MVSLADGLGRCIEIRRLVPPCVQYQVTVYIDPHSIGSNHGKLVVTLAEREVALPAGGEIEWLQGGVRGMISPIEVNLAARPEIYRMTGQRHVAAVPSGEEVGRRIRTRSAKGRSSRC